MDVLHTAIWVSDVEASAAFYCDGIGLTYSREFEADGILNYFVTGDDGTEIQYKHDPTGCEDVDPAGIDHLAVGVDDIQATVDRLRTEFDSTVIQSPTELDATESTVAFVTDPDEYTVELIE